MKSCTFSVTCDSFVNHSTLRLTPISHIPWEKAPSSMEKEGVVISPTNTAVLRSFSFYLLDEVIYHQCDRFQLLHILFPLADRLLPPKRGAKNPEAGPMESEIFQIDEIDHRTFGELLICGHPRSLRLNPLKL